MSECRHPEVASNSVRMPVAKVSRTAAKILQSSLQFIRFFHLCSYWFTNIHSSGPDVVCQLAAPYSTWIGSHNITMTWESLNQSDVVYILQWTGPSLSGIWAQAEVVNDFMFIFVILITN